MRAAPVWIIQDRSSGAFLSVDLDWVTSFKDAGRCRDYQEAIDTAYDNSEPGEFEIHQFFEIER